MLVLRSNYLPTYVALILLYYLSLIQLTFAQDSDEFDDSNSKPGNEYDIEKGL